MFYGICTSGETLVVSKFWGGGGGLIIKMFKLIMSRRLIAYCDTVRDM